MLSRVAKRAVLIGIEKMKKISSITLQVALKEGYHATKSTFSQGWTAPRTVLNLSRWPLALINIEFHVADVELAAEDLLIGLPVSRQLSDDIKMLL